MDRPITVGELRKVLEAGSCNAEFGAVEAISAMLSAIPKDEPDNLNGVPIHNIDDFQAEILLQSGACTLGGLIECYKRYGEKFEQEEMKKSEPEADKLPHFHQGICKKCGRLKWLKDDTTMCAECMNEPDPPRDIETNSPLPDNLKDEILDFKMKLMGKHGVHPIDSDWEAFILEREARLQSLNAELVKKIGELEQKYESAKDWSGKLAEWNDEKSSLISDALKMLKDQAYHPKGLARPADVRVKEAIDILENR